MHHEILFLAANSDRYLPISQFFAAHRVAEG